VVAKHKKDIERVKVLALHGMSKDAWHRFGDRGYKHYYVVESGFKYNMMDLQAAIGIHQLRRVEENWRRRKEIWKRYQEAFRELHVERPTEPDSNTRHAYHLYCLLIDEKKSGISRDRFLETMTRRKNRSRGPLSEPSGASFLSEEFRMAATGLPPGHEGGTANR